MKTKIIGGMIILAIILILAFIAFKPRQTQAQDPTQLQLLEQNQKRTLIESKLATQNSKVSDLQAQLKTELETKANLEKERQEIYSKINSLVNGEPKETPKSAEVSKETF